MTQEQIDRIADDVRGYLRLHPDAKVGWVWHFGKDYRVGEDGYRTSDLNGTATFTLKANGGAVDNGLTEEERALLDAIEADPAGFEAEEDKEV